MKRALRFISVVMSVMMIFTSFALIVANAETVDGFVISQLNGKISINGIDANIIKGDIVIPDTLNGKTVAYIGDRAFQNPSITSVVIPSGVESVGNSAFKNCSNLELVEFKSGSSATLGKEAFADCSSLNDVTLPDNLKEIPDNCFDYCKSLEEIYIPASVNKIGNYSFFHCSALKAFNVAGDSNYFKSQNNCLVSKNGETLYQYSLGLGSSSASVPAGVKEIKMGAFAYSSVSSVTLPSTLEYIDSFGFYNCEKLSTVTLPDSLKEIGASAFSNCYALKSIKVPANVVNFENAFSYSGLESVTVAASDISLNAFQQSASLKTAVLESTVKSIGSAAFYSCNALTTLHIPSSVTSVASNALGGIADKSAVTICSDKAVGSAADFASAQGISFKVCSGHESEPVVPHTHTDANSDNICDNCGETISPVTPVSASAKIVNNPGQKTVKHGYTLHLKAEVTAGYKAKWEIKGDCVTYDVSGSDCYVTVNGSGIATIVVTPVDASGKVAGNSDSETIEAKSNFFLRIIAFFKKLFGSNMNVEN